jgi:hypothetical protein
MLVTASIHFVSMCQPGSYYPGHHSHFPQANTVESFQENKISTNLSPEAVHLVEGSELHYSCGW